MFESTMQPEDLELVLQTLRDFGKRRLDEKTLLSLDREGRCPEEIIREMDVNVSYYTIHRCRLLWGDAGES